MCVSICPYFLRGSKHTTHTYRLPRNKYPSAASLWYGWRPLSHYKLFFYPATLFIEIGCVDKLFMLGFQNTVHCFSKTSMIVSVTLSVSEQTICATRINCMLPFCMTFIAVDCSLQSYSLIIVEVKLTFGKKCGVDCVVKKRTKIIFDQRTILPEKSMNLSLFFAFRDTFLPLKIVNLHTLAVACTLYASSGT